MTHYDYWLGTQWSEWKTVYIQFAEQTTQKHANKEVKAVDKRIAECLTGHGSC